jgi:UDP-N-acetylmuramate: L-alanyl-gamma-D-glutamyl-meso-diaminopimelate ligase
MSTTPAQPENIVAHVAPETVKRVHVLGVAGTGMGSFAGLLQAAGFAVTGSDENIYPPMSDMLKAWNIAAMSPYKPENLDAARADLCIVGNVIRRVNPEATAMRERGLPHMSFPAALGDLFLATRHPVVVAGTHGKTTTSALMSHVLVHAGRDPSFLVGGVARNYTTNFRLGRGPHFVVEGDEYDTAYFDKGPKFLHYRPKSLILTSVEFDHADIYRDLAHYESSFQKLLALLPEDGFTAVCAHWPNAVALARAAKGRVETYGAHHAQADWTAADVSLGAHGARFTALRGGEPQGQLDLQIPGEHNVENALGVYATARALGLTHAEIAAGMATFTGVKRRQELLGEPWGVALVDDFAHHPTAVRETLAAVASRFPGRRLVALFEPRSNTSRRNIHQEDYAHAFGPAQHALILKPKPHDQVPLDAQLDADKLAAALAAAGTKAQAFGAVGELAEAALALAQPGDVFLVMSNGAFGGLLKTLQERLGGRS